LKISGAQNLPTEQKRENDVSAFAKRFFQMFRKLAFDDFFAITPVI
jgi:hypothetical protein